MRWLYVAVLAVLFVIVADAASACPENYWRCGERVCCPL